MFKTPALVNPLLPRLKIRAKLALTFVILLSLVIGITSTLWLATVRTILHRDLTTKQNQLGRQATQKIESFIDAKKRALIIHSQSAAFLTHDSALQKLDLAIFLSQDQDLHQLNVINPQGLEIMKIMRAGASFSESTDYADRSQSPSFFANTFRYSKEYIGDVQFLPSGEPYLLISIPIQAPISSQRLTDLSTQNLSLTTESTQLLGVLEAQVSLNSLFGEITDLGLDQDTSVFIVDKQGRIIAHPTKSLVGPKVVTSQYPPVKQHLETLESDPISHQETSTIFQYPNEQGVSVLGSHSHVKETGWAVVTQQSAARAYADLNYVLVFAIVLLAIVIAISIPLIYYLSKKITTPLLALTSGANQISQGNLDVQLHITTQDELQDLAQAFTNMTQKLKKSMDQISAERNKLEVIIFGIEDAVIAINKNQQITLLNPAAQKLIELDPSQALNHHLSDVFTLYDQDKQIPSSRYCPPDKPTLTGIVFEQKIIKLKTTRGVEKYVNLISGKIKEDRHSDVDFILTIHDITEERKLEEMKLDFVSMAAHELRTPLTSIIGFALTLKNNLVASMPPEFPDMLNRIYLNGRRLSSLVDNILDVSHIERGDLKAQFSRLDLASAAKSSVAEMDQLAQSKHQTLTLSPTLTQALVFADPFKIAEVFTNLIANAINYTPDGGTITVSLADQPDSYLVTVTDTGMGIPADAIPHLFTKFYRVSHGLEQTSKGSGLGLYITKSIITLHQGKIWLTSVLGRGTSVFFTLPKITPDQQTQSPATPTNGKPSGILHNPNLPV